MFDKSKTFVMMRSDYSAVLGGKHGWDIDHDFDHAWRVAQNYPGKIVTFETAEYILRLRRELDDAVKVEHETIYPLLERAASLIHSDWDGTDDNSPGNRWLSDFASVRARDKSTTMS